MTEISNFFRFYSSMRKRSITLDPSVKLEVFQTNKYEIPPFDRTVFDRVVKLSGPKGTLSLKICRGLGIHITGGSSGDERSIQVKPEKLSYEKLDRRRKTFVDSMWGTTASLLRRNVEGVANGHQLPIRIVGVGYKASLVENNIVLKLGFSHDVELKIPNKISAQLLTPTKLLLTGPCYQEVTQFAAKIRSFRVPEPYNGKGIYVGNETIKLKEGKK